MTAMHKDFEYWKEIAIEVFCDFGNAIDMIKSHHIIDYKKTEGMKRFSFHDFIVLNDSSYVDAIPSMIRPFERGDNAFVEVTFDAGIYFIIDEKYLTCHVSENKISGTPYFKYDKEIRESIYIEKKLFS